MKALFVIPEYPPGYGGGIGTYYGALFPALRARGIEITAVVGSSLAAGPVASALDGVEVVPLDRARAASLKARFSDFCLAPDFTAHLAAAWAAWEQTDGGRGYDVVECTDWGLFFVPWIVSEEAPPALVRMHASIGQIGRYDPQSGYILSETLAGFTEEILLPYAGSLATYGKTNQSDWADRLRRDVSYVPPPFVPLLGETGDTNPSDAGLVVGRVQSWKGPDTLCRALGRLGNDAPTIDWIGRDLPLPGQAGTMGSRLRSNHPEIWGAKIRHQDPLPPSAIRERQSSARFVVVPSDWDVFNLGAAEALSTGAIVVCSQGAGASDLIDDGINGFLFPARDDAVLADCIHRVISLTPGERERISCAARATVAETLDPTIIAALHAEQLRQTVDASRRPVSADQRSRFSPSTIMTFGEAGLERLPIRELTRHLRDRMLTKFRR